MSFARGEPVRAADTAPLQLESKIPLGDIRGRIDHLAVDVVRKRLYVAELGNDTMGVVDLAERKLLRTLTGLREPQGIGYVASTDTLFVANAGDGSVRVFQGRDLVPTGRIELGDDADNVRVDDAGRRVYVGYGSGALAVIDSASQKKIADIPLKAHPESFQFEQSGPRIFVNVPSDRQIAVVDRSVNKQIATWPTGHLWSNYPLALDARRGRIIAVFRLPASVGVFQASDGRQLSSLKTCGDSDDVFVDEKRNRLYVVCGEGYVDVLAPQDQTYVSLGRIATSPGARTALFVPSLDQLAVAVRATSANPAAVWLFRPLP
jgi:DNA-binding beta-propeller fold protein YncE